MSSRFIMLSVAGAAAAAVLVLPPRAAADQAAAGVRSRNIVAHPTTRLCSGDVPRKRRRHSIPLAPRTADLTSAATGVTGRRRKKTSKRPGTTARGLEPAEKVQRDAGPGKSLIVDPPDGKLPLQPWAEAQKRENEASYIDQNTLCFLSGVPRFMYESGAYQILQAPESITILSEEAHAFRVIAMDGRPRIAKNIRLWLGDARGRWEGNTLVVETTNQNGRVFLDRRGTFYTDAATVTERFTMLDRNTIAYGATVDDPLVYTRPFTIGFMLTRHTTKDFEIWEDACFEGSKDAEMLYSIGLKKYPGITSEDVPALKARTPSR